MNCYHLSLSKMSKKKKKRNFIWPLKVLNYIVGKMKYYNDEYDTDMDTRTKLPFQISYAMSIHKAQGLEFDSVKIVITKESDEQVTKNIFYTAVTRAKKNLKVYWQPEVADYVLGNIENSADSKTADLSILSEQLKKYI